MRPPPNNSYCGSNDDAGFGSRAQYCTPTVGAEVIDSQGIRASVLARRPEVPPKDSSAHADADDLVVLAVVGQEVMLPCSLLQHESEQAYRVPFAFADLLEQGTPAHCPDRVALPGRESARQSMPVVEEVLHVGTRLIDTGRGVRIHKTVLQTPHLLEQSLLQEEMTIEHVRHDRALDADEVPEVRYEGETLIIPVLEEVLVVQKQLRLKEEIHVIRTRHSVSASQTVILDAEQVHIERFDENGDRCADESKI